MSDSEAERQAKKPGAPLGNRNAATGSQPGMRFWTYLSGAEVDALDGVLAERGQKSTDELRRQVARELLRHAIKEAKP